LFDIFILQEYRFSMTNLIVLVLFVNNTIKRIYTITLKKK